MSLWLYFNQQITSVARLFLTLIEIDTCYGD